MFQKISLPRVFHAFAEMYPMKFAFQTENK